MKQLKCSLPDDLAAWVRLKAVAIGESVSFVVRDALREQQRRDGKENGK
jgi:hypothetical protein